MKKQGWVTVTAFLLAFCLLYGCKAPQKGNASSTVPSKSTVSGGAITSPKMQSSQASIPQVPLSSVPSDTVKKAADVFSLIDGTTVPESELLKLPNVKKGWGQGREVDAQNRPVSCNSYQKKYGSYGAIFIMPNTENSMYLTFDEGYENGYTSKILDTLKEKNVHAVFFVTLPYVKENPQLVKRMIDEGHIVGNHSVHHKSMPTLSLDTAASEISGLHNYMLEHYKYQMTLFRPPMGEWSTRTLGIAKALGYKTVLWSYAYQDWDPKKQMGVAKAFPKVVNAAHPGAVYLLHAVSKDNASMLSQLIDAWQEKGYTLKLLAS